MKSKKYRLNTKDLKDIGVMVLAVAFSYLVTDVLPLIDFGKYQTLAALVIPVLTYSAKKYQQGK